MALTFHKVYGIYRLGADPEIRYTPNGAAVANFSAASGHRYKKDDEWVEETEWTRVVAWNRLAEKIGEQAQKGSLVYIEGRLVTRKWEDKEGNTRYTTELNAFKVDFLADYNKPQAQGGYNNPPPQGETRPQTERPEDDIPF